MLRRVLIAIVLLILPALTAAQAVDDVTRGFSDGTRAGRRTKTIFPFATSAVIAPVLAATHQGNLGHNEIVAALVTETAIAAGVTFVAGMALKPRPSTDQEAALSERPPLYTASWRKGYNDASGQRQLLSRAAGIVAGALISGVIYGLREDPPTRR